LFKKSINIIYNNIKGFKMVTSTSRSSIPYVTTASTPSKIQEDTPLQLQILYDNGKNNQDKDLTATQANDIITNLGIDFGNYTTTLETAITGMTRIEAFLYLMNLISSMDAKDGASDDSSDYKLDKSANLTSIFNSMGLGDAKKCPKENRAQIEESLKKIGTQVYKDDKDIDATDKELIETFNQGNASNAEPPTINDKAWVGMMQLQDAFGNNADTDGDGISDDLEKYNKDKGTNYTEAEYQKILDSFENNTNVVLGDTGLSLDAGAVNYWNNLINNGTVTIDELYEKLDANLDGIFDIADLQRIAARDNDDPNLDDAIITKHEIETVLRDVARRRQEMNNC
jgi:hypothetical protein